MTVNIFAKRKAYFKSANSGDFNHIFPNMNVHPGVQLDMHPGGQQRKVLPFGHGRDLAAFNGTGLQKSFQDRAEISKA